MADPIPLEGSPDRAGRPFAALAALGCLFLVPLVYLSREPVGIGRLVEFYWTKTALMAILGLGGGALALLSGGGGLRLRVAWAPPLLALGVLAGLSFLWSKTLWRGLSLVALEAGGAGAALALASGAVAPLSAVVALFAGGVLASVQGLFQSWGLLPLPLLTPEIQQVPKILGGRFEPTGGLPLATLGSPEAAAGFVAAVLPLGVALMASRSDRRERGVLAAILSLAVAFVISAGNRGAWVSLLVVAFFAGAWMVARRGVRPRSLALWGGVVAVLALLLAGSAARRGILPRFEGLFERESGAVVYRWNLWKAEAGVVASHPLLGTGLGDTEVEIPRHYNPRLERYLIDRDQLVRRAENDHVKLAGDLGLLGLVVWLSFLGALAGAVRRILRRPEVPWEIAGVAFTLGVLGLESIFAAPLREPATALVFWAALGILAFVEGTSEPREPSRPLWIRAGAAIVLAAMALGSAWFSVRRARGSLAYMEASAHLFRRDFNEAKASFEASLRLDPWNERTFYEAGVWLSQNGFPDMAEPLLERSLALFPDLPGAHYYLGQNYARKGDTRRAIRELEATRSLLTLPAPNLFGMLAMLYFRAGEYQSGVVVGEEALAVDPRDDKILLGLGNAYSELHRYGDAASAYERLIEMTPANWEAHVNLAAAYLNLHRESEARAEIEKARPHLGKSGYLWYNLAAIDAVEGKKNAAKNDLQRAMALEPGLRSRAARDKVLSPFVEP